jgi:hypothetical protein
MLERVIRNLGVKARLVGKPEGADVILSLRSRADDARIKKAVARSNTPVHTLKRSTATEMRRVLRQLFPSLGGMDEEEAVEAVREAEHAIGRVQTEGVSVALAPRPPRLRKLQHSVIVRHALEAHSEGSEPRRHLVVSPPGGAPLGSEAD